jgi:hypothetical protein
LREGPIHHLQTFLAQSNPKSGDDQAGRVRLG